LKVAASHPVAITTPNTLYGLVEFRGTKRKRSGVFFNAKIMENQYFPVISLEALQLSFRSSGKVSENWLEN